MNYRIDQMQISDWPEVAAIYQAGIETGVATFQPEVPTWENWDRDHLSICRLVLRVQGQLVAWAALSPTSSRPVYAGVTEVSIYISPDRQGQGIGKILLNELIDLSEANGIWTVQSTIIYENETSIKLHQACGFRMVGIREKQGKMPSGKWHDVVLMERRSPKIGWD